MAVNRRCQAQPVKEDIFRLNIGYLQIEWLIMTLPIQVAFFGASAIFDTSEYPLVN